MCAASSFVQKEVGCWEERYLHPEEERQVNHFKLECLVLDVRVVSKTEVDGSVRELGNFSGQK